MPRYRLYIDESGDHTYKRLDDIGHRYLALLGVWFKQEEDYLNFVHELKQFKDNLFGERPEPKKANIAGLQLADVLAYPVKTSNPGSKGVGSRSGRRFWEKDLRSGST